MKTRLFTLGIIFVMLCMLLTSCFDGPKVTTKPSATQPTTSKIPDEPSVTYTVTFINGDEVFKTVQVTEGETVSEPEVPSKAGTESTSFVFDGWYNGEVKWDFANDKVTTDITLSAKFTEEINSYEVKILDINGNEVSTSTVIHGTKLTQPETPSAPTQDGATFTFDGWYNGDKKWDFENDIVVSSMSLKPVFTSELIDVTIRFEYEDGTVIETVTTKYGTTPVCSTIPVKAGTDSKIYVFAGWDKELVPATDEVVYVAQFKEYTVGIGNVDTFAADTIHKNEENKYINACYNYSSISGSVFPIIVDNEALVFNVFSTDTFGVLNIDLGSVKAGVTYYLSMDLVMKDKDGNLLKDGFAYAFSATPNVTTGGAALTSYAVLAVNGANGFLYTPTQDLEHLYFCIRTQKDKGYMESTATIDNVLLKEVNLAGANIANGTITEDFSDGIVVAEGNQTIWYGDVKVYSPNKNAVVYAQDGKLYVNAEQSGQKGLVGFYIDGIVAGKTYEVTMDLNLYDASGENKPAAFTMMVYANNNAFSGSRYNLYLGDNADNHLTITPTVDNLITDGKVTFKFTATQDGYVVVTLRANGAPLYAEIDNFSMKEVTTYAFIKFEDENGNQIGEIVKYEAGQEIEIPAALAKDPSDTTVYTFDGWYHGETKLEAGAKATVNATYKAKYSESAREYTITYYNDDDTVYKTVTLAYGAAVELIAVPEKDGNNGVWVGDVYATMPAQNISYKASYTVVSYTATITLNGEVYKTYTFTADDRADKLALILNEFVNDAQYTYSHQIPAELPLDDCAYDVVRTVNEYTVKFVVDGVEEVLTLAYGATPSPSATPSKDGYTFTGWTPAIATVTGDATYTAVFAADSLDVTEDFENGSISGKNYTGTNLNAMRPNDNSGLELVQYNGSTALAITRLSSKTSGGYAGLKIDVKPNTTYVVTLDLEAVGATTADLSGSSAILFEVYENASIGTSAARLSMFSNTGRALTTNQKISSFKSGTQYQVVFTTSDFEGDSGYVYFTVRLDKSLTEDTTVYIDNVHVNECNTHVNENFDNVTEINDQIAKGANSTISVEDGALKATCTSGKQGFLGVYVKVEAGKTYIVHFDATVKGADGTDYSAGTSGGNSATVMVYQNAFGNNDARLNFMASKANATVTNTPLVNTLNTATPNYSLTFTATADGYVYITLRTNSIAQESYITIDNMVVSELELD